MFSWWRLRPKIEDIEDQLRELQWQSEWMTERIKQLENELARRTNNEVTVTHTGPVTHTVCV